MVRGASTRTIPNFHRTHEALRSLNVDTTKLYRLLGIRESDLHAENSGVTMGTYLELLRRAAEQERRPFLGLEIAMTRNVANLGALGYLMRNAPDFEHSLTMIDSYLDLIMPGCISGLIKRELDCIWTYEVPGFSPAQARHEIDMGLMQFIGTVRELFSLPDWRPAEVFFQHEPPGDTEPLRIAMADTLHFGHYFSGVAFPQEFLRYAIGDADPQLLRVLEQQVQRSINELKEDGTLIGRITFMIASRLGKTDVSADSLASRIGMSRRTLHRRLNEQGTSFNALREVVVLRIAKEALATTSVSITELAQELGYSDASAFDRAFKRLTGLSPLSYRRQHGNAAFLGDRHARKRA